MYDTVLDNCDLDAATFVVTMMEKAMAKLTSFLKCYGNFIKIVIWGFLSCLWKKLLIQIFRKEKNFLYEITINKNHIDYTK